MIYRSSIHAGPAGDHGLAALAEVIRYGWAVGLVPQGTGEQAMQEFASFLAGHGQPAPKP